MKDVLSPAVTDVISRPNLEKKLRSGKKLRVKFGADPSAPNLHLGHFVALDQLRRLSEAGHKVIFLIGDFTALIGDPTGRNKMRPALTTEQVKHNVKTYLDQVALILDIKKIEIRYNSEWLAKFKLEEWLKILGQFSANNILERDDFAKRLKEKQTLGMHELMYPIMQAYDSVMLKADVEVGGTDQRFNMLAGRELQRKMDQAPQDVVLVSLLVGTDGERKMSKSLDNTVDLTDAPENMFGKIMSIPDETVKEYARLVLGVAMSDLQKKAGDQHPMAVKKELAREIVEKFYHGSGQLAQDHFERVVGRKEIPDHGKIPQYVVQGNESLKSVLLNAVAVSSGTQVMRLVEQKAIRIDDKVIGKSDLYRPVERKEQIIKIGKRKYLKVTKK
jgi:tyrosyl-tRNA synthetase